MQLRWNGTAEERYHRLELDGRRCDANSRRCVHPAVVIFTLLPAKDWEPIEGAEAVTKQSCARHRMQFNRNANYKVIAVNTNRPNPRPGTGPVAGTGPRHVA